MITPDDLAVRFAPQVTRGPLHDRQLRFADGAYQLAEQALDALPRGHYLDQTVTALETAAHWVCAGLAAAVAEQAVEADAQVPYPLTLPTADALAAVPAREGIGEGLDLNVSLWRIGLRGAMALFPLARLVAYTFAEYAGPAGYIADADQPSIEALCIATGTDSTGVLHAIEELAADGWISRHTDGDLTRYQLRMPTPTAR